MKDNILKMHQPFRNGSLKEEVSLKSNAAVDSGVYLLFVWYMYKYFF